CFNSYYKKDYLDKRGNRDRHKIRVGLNRISKGESISNNNSSGLNLGCTNRFFSKWLDYQRSLSEPPIVEEELDHVLPIKEFKDYPELCFSWFNMRPMEKTENRQKSATIDWELFNEQLDRSVSFMTMMNEESWFNYRDQNLLSDFNRIITQYFNNYPKFNLFLINKD
ncbi:hypothetical protein, partial [Bartonella sp. CL32QHWL-2]|uniref:hypothetical protein n=1 Tax=Bartonella sp. CL32QHWL-2 TaxID=3243525 RepID=UPI0035CF88A0